MSRSPLRLVIVVLISTATVNTLSDFANHILQFSSPPDLPALYPSNQTNQTNQSVTILNSSVEAGFEVSCDGSYFGYNLNLRDCYDAEDYIIPDTTQRTFAERGAAIGRDFYPLPYRVMGDKAECLVEAVLKDKEPFAIANLDRIKRAARSIILQCVANTPSTGGLATSIGGDNNLGVVVAAYNPKVECRGTLPKIWQSCTDLLERMPADLHKEIFGLSSDPAASVHLPQQITSEDGRCALRVFSKGGSDTSSWYRIWGAATAVFSVCVRHRKGGNMRDLGNDGHLFITMTEQVGVISNASLIAAA